MYAKSDIPAASNDPSIVINFSKLTPPITLSVLVFDARDNPSEIMDTLDLPLCAADSCSKGTFLLPAKNFSTKPFNQAFQVNESTFKVDYKVEKTAFYCVAMTSRGSFEASISYTNPYGLAPGMEYPKLPVRLAEENESSLNF